MCTCVYKCSFEVIAYILFCQCPGMGECYHTDKGMYLCVYYVPGGMNVHVTEPAYLSMHSCAWYVCTWTSPSRHRHMNFCKSA